MELIHKTIVQSYHRERIAAHGVGSTKATGWLDDAALLQRYELLYHPKMNGKTLLDLGCGHGAFRAFLAHKNWKGTYHGIDLMPEFIAHAQQQFDGFADTHFTAGDFSETSLPEADIIIGAGAFSYGAPNGLDNKTYNLNMVRKAFNHAKEGLVLNMLNASTAAQPDHPILLSYDIDSIKALATALTDDYHVLKHPKLPSEFTMHLWKS